MASLACMEMLQVVMRMICFLIMSAAPCLPLHRKLNVLHSFGLPLRHPFTDSLSSFPVPSTHLPLVPRLPSFLSSLCLPSLLSSLCFLSATSLFCAHAALPESIRCSDVLRPLRERLQRLSSSRYLSHSLSHSLQPRCVNPHLPTNPTPLVPLSPSGFSLDTLLRIYVDGHQLTLNKCPLGWACRDWSGALCICVMCVRVSLILCVHLFMYSARLYCTCVFSPLTQRDPTTLSHTQHCMA